MAAQAQTRIALTQIAHDMIRAESDPGMAEITQPHVIERWEGQKEIFSREFQEGIDVLTSEL